MDAPQIVALTGLLATVGSGAGWLIVRWDKRRPAVPRSEAVMAGASQATRDALDVVQQSLSTDLERVRREAEEDRERHRRDRESDRGRITLLEREVHAIRDGWSVWYRDLSDRWSHHREQARPPYPPDLT